MVYQQTKFDTSIKTDSFSSSGNMDDDFLISQQVGSLYKPKLCLYFKYLEFLSDPDA